MGFFGDSALCVLFTEKKPKSRWGPSLKGDWMVFSPPVSIRITERPFTSKTYDTGTVVHFF